MSRNSGNIFERMEKKYMLSEQQHRLFLKKVEGKIILDQFGLHKIGNIYYDTPDFDLIRHSIEKPPYKEKVRLRGYGDVNQDSTVFLELKKKYKGIVYKRRVPLEYHEAMDYLKTGKMPIMNNQIMREIDYCMHFYQLVPMLYLAYDRRAYFGAEDSSLRLTIDQNIRSREDYLELTCGDSGKLLQKGIYLMEIKVPFSYPLWLTNILSELQIFPVSFSKYGNVYKKKITDKREEQECLPIYLAM